MMQPRFAVFFFQLSLELERAYQCYVQVMTVRTTAFEKAAAEGGSAAVEAAPAFTADAGDCFRL